MLAISIISCDTENQSENLTTDTLEEHMGNKNMTTANTSGTILIEPSEYYDALSFDSIIELNSGIADIIYFPNTILPKEINVKFTTGTILTPKDAVLALSSVRDIMRIDDISYSVMEIDRREHMGFNVFYLKQIYKGLEVFNGSFEVIATFEGEPVAVSGYHVNGIDLDITPKLSSTKSKKSIKLEKGTKISSSRLIIYEVFDAYDEVISDSIDNIRLCWLFEIYSTDVLKQKEIIVDANTGDILSDIPLAIS